MVMTRSTCRKAANPSPSHAQPLTKKARSSKEVVKLQRLLESMDINKRPRTSRGHKTTKGASRPAGNMTQARQAPYNSPDTRSRSFLVGFESSLPPSPSAICAASPYPPILVHSPVSVPADTQSTSSDPHLQTALPVPAPPWMSAPPISQYTLESVISELEGCNIDQRPTTSEEATGPAITTRWLPPAPAAEEPEDSSYDMSILKDALDDCGRVPRANEYISFGYHREPQPQVVYRRPAIDYSSCPYAPPPLEVGKVKKLRKYKTTGAPYSHEPALRKKRRYSSDSDQSESQGCLPNIPEAVAALPYISLRRARTMDPPSYEQPPPVSDPNFPYGSDYWS